jgi:hypothetical protein
MEHFLLGLASGLIGGLVVVLARAISDKYRGY